MSKHTPRKADGLGVSRPKKSGSVSGSSSAKKPERPPTTSRARAQAIAAKARAKRHALYKKVLVSVQHDYGNNGLCMHFAAHGCFRMNELPEIMAQKPKRFRVGDAWWWGPRNLSRRVEALKAAIKASAPALAARNREPKAKSGVSPTERKRAVKGSGRGSAKATPKPH